MATLFDQYEKSKPKNPDMQKGAQIQDAIEFIDKHHNDLTIWETNFFKSIKRSWFHSWDLTNRQYDSLMQIHRRLLGLKR